MNNFIKFELLFIINLMISFGVLFYFIFVKNLLMIRFIIFLGVTFRLTELEEGDSLDSNYNPLLK